MLEDLIIELCEVPECAQSPLLVATESELTSDIEHPYFHLVQTGESIIPTVVNALMGMAYILLGEEIPSRIQLEPRKLNLIKEKIENKDIEDKFLVSFGDFTAPFQLFQGLLDIHEFLEAEDYRVDVMVCYVSLEDAKEYLRENCTNQDIEYIHGGPRGCGSLFLEASMTSTEMLANGYTHLYNLSGRQYKPTEKFIPVQAFVIRPKNVFQRKVYRARAIGEIVYSLKHARLKERLWGGLRILCNSILHGFALDIIRYAIPVLTNYNNTVVARGDIPEKKLSELAQETTAENYFGSLSGVFNLNMACVILPPEFVLGAMDLDLNPKAQGKEEERIENNERWYQENYPSVVEATRRDIPAYLEKLSRGKIQIHAPRE
ncbi:hypothetical protein JXB41_01205 [Candidatus Woesearchaeota archaeon]|nr:hypothetical protein [Candidatus Woesearchaeota archaeon]